MIGGAGTDADLLTLQQWLSPAFPVGGFAWSHGLEMAIASGEVTDAPSLAQWLETVIARGSGAADATLLAAAMAPGADHAGLAALARGLAGSAERLAETDAQGAAFTQAQNALAGTDHAPAPLPVAVGRAAASLSLAPVTVAALYLQAFAANLVSAAVRFMPLGATAGQLVLRDLRPAILQAAEASVARVPEEIVLSQPGADLASMAHETLPVRIFRS